jgi:RND family efflux transporter MFP subunit
MMRMRSLWIWGCAPALLAALPLALPLAAPVAAAGEPPGLAGFDCVIEPHSITEVSTRETGILEALTVGRGDRVEAGQAIGWLNRAVEEATVALAEARAGLEAEIGELEEGLAYAERERERLDQLGRAKAVSATETDKATSEAKRAALRLQQALEQRRIAELDLERSRRHLANRTLKSPVDGVVMERLMAPGEAAENRPVVRIAEIDPLNVEVFVPVEHFGGIRVGMTAEVMPRYPGAEPQRAAVTIVDQVIDAASDTFGVRLALPNPTHRIPAGVRCDIRFLTDTAAGAAPSPR